jgi:hypothetical protein
MAAFVVAFNRINDPAVFAEYAAQKRFASSDGLVVLVDDDEPGQRTDPAASARDR